MQIGFVHDIYRAIFRHGASIAFALAVSACSTAPPPPQVNPKERDQREVVLGGELARQLESQLKIQREPEISTFIGEIARELASSDPELRESPIGVSVIRDRGGIWRNYSLPGIRVYLSASMLKRMTFENELAAAVAFELGHIRARNVIEQLRRSSSDAPVSNPSIFEGLTLPQPGDSPVRIDFFGHSGVFSYPEDLLLNALTSSVELMYSAGYDPRGMVSLLLRFQANASVSPYEQSTLSRLIDRTREIIAQHAPLRNPIVRSDKFLAIQKRMQRL